jgi:Flp pilus assembly protein TadG
VSGSRPFDDAHLVRCICAVTHLHPRQERCKRSSTSHFRLVRRLHRRLRQESGQALVEFALVFPVLLLIILGILDFGRYMNYSNQESQMAAQGARLAAVAYAPAGSVTLQNYLVSNTVGGLGTQSGDVTKAAQAYVYYPTGSTGNVIGQPIRACVVATITLPVNLIGVVPPLKMVQTATMRIEQLLPTTSPPWTVDSTSTASTAGCPLS